MTRAAAAANTKQVTTFIFDVDDTLYDVSNCFTEHRNGGAAQQFMVDFLDFPSVESAQKLRDEYFVKYHATAKALTVAEQEGRFPPPKDPSKAKTPRFRTEDLANYWATNLDFSLLGGTKPSVLQDFKDCKLNMVAFSNGPRGYVKRVLQELGLFEIFGEERLFAVDDVLPHCKPEKEAFEKIFEKVGCSADECIMVEDSMKNIRRAKELGMKTILVTGKGRMRKNVSGPSAGANESSAEGSCRILPGDAPVEDDPAVDIAIETIEEIRAAVPGLWSETPTFGPV